MIGTFSSADSALLLIDHQVGTMKLIKNIPLDVVKRNTLALAKTAKILNIPVVLTSSQEQNVQGPLLPELEQILPEAFAARVQRAGIVNAWSDPHFKKAVEATGRRNLIMAGVTTDVCLVYPAISACRGLPSTGSYGRFRVAIRTFRRYVAAAHGTRGSSAYRNKHAHGRTRSGLESARRWPIAWHTVSRRTSTNRLTRRSTGRQFRCAPLPPVSFVVRRPEMEL